MPNLRPRASCRFAIPTGTHFAQPRTGRGPPLSGSAAARQRTRSQAALRTTRLAVAARSAHSTHPLRRESSCLPQRRSQLRRRRSAGSRSLPDPTAGQFRAREPGACRNRADIPNTNLLSLTHVYNANTKPCDAGRCLIVPAERQTDSPAVPVCARERGPDARGSRARPKFTQSTRGWRVATTSFRRSAPRVR